MRTECLNSKFLYDEALPVSRLVAAVGSSILSIHLRRYNDVV